jgi:uncharacterized protein (DUF2249 family)
VETTPSSKLDRRFQDLEIRRAFTVFQLMTILEEARNSLIIIGHDPCFTHLEPILSWRI